MEIHSNSPKLYYGFKELRISPTYIHVHVDVLSLRSCHYRAVKTSDFHTGGPRFEPRPDSSALGQSALSSLPSLSEETLRHRSHVSRRVIPYMHIKEPTSLLAKSLGEIPVKWPDSTNRQLHVYTWVERPMGHSYNFSPPWQTRRLPNQ